MTVRSGSESSVAYNGTTFTGRSWSLSTNRSMLNVTPSYNVLSKFAVGTRRTTGQVSLFYDPDDTAAMELLTQVTAGTAPATLTLYLDSGTPLSVEALFTRRSISAQVGSAYAVTLGFQATGPVTGVF